MGEIKLFSMKTLNIELCNNFSSIFPQIDRSDIGQEFYFSLILC